MTAGPAAPAGPSSAARWPRAAFAILAAATFAAFFIVQHLKVATPLINGFPAPFPRSIDPLAGGVCELRTGTGARRPVSFRSMRISFYLQNRPDEVDVYVIDAAGRVVRQIGSDARMRVDVRRTFRWNGRLADGRPAPDGVYEIRVDLIHQHRSLVIADQSTGAPETVTVDTAVPHPAVISVSPRLDPAGAHEPVQIRYTGAGPGVRLVRVVVYRLAGGRVRSPVAAYTTDPRRAISVWSATVRGRPAPPGSYLIAVRVTDAACTTGSSPVSATVAPQAVVRIG
ncbi:MAG TPA: FlgD immunoglobulin-like domain containing protein [Solirubrobacteraceae bacterium]|nr:FlgD immunoglobulin-like domain containing protein [Solirubrobacteraceae bacterium]